MQPYDPWTENRKRIKFLEQRLSILEDLLYETLDHINEHNLLDRIECVLNPTVANE